MCGHHHLFSHEGLSSTWYLFHEITIFKADVVELILNSSKEIKKAWFYKFIEPWLGRGVLTSYDEKWKIRRKLLTPALHFSVLKEYLPIRNKHGRIIRDNLSTSTEEEFINIYPLMGRSSFNIISECAFDKESQTKSQDLYLSKIHELTSSVFERIHRSLHWIDFIYYRSSAGKAFSKALEVTRDLTNKIIFQKIKERKENKQNAIPVNEDSLHKHTQSQLQKSAFMDLLVEEHLKNNSLSENDIRQEVDSFVFAGHDTTSVTMSWCLWMIGLHPWIQDKIHEELDIIFGEDDRESTVEDLNNMKYLECVVKETMRLYPPVPIIAREIRNDIQYGKYTIPKDSTCVVYAYVLHRDPDVFPDPERFDPERFTAENSAGRNPFAYVPFSAGPRNCLGQRFAMLEIKILLSSILRRYKMRSLDPRDKVHTLAEMVLRPSNGLRIQVRRRDQSFDFHSVYYRPPEESLVSQLKIT
ncbi:cytochrome P450 4V2-like isoform X2 [Argiope bruennichi]|nr:cytochrome P450 4V2-like isoform X2 [Argiope bruennichi]XP_055947681.1 cytochrome P450 4V2-like isoform X2 [Argiope bruennichi]